MTTTTTPTEVLSPEERLKATGVRRLHPDGTTIFEGTFSLLHCAVKNDDLYRGVFAVRMFPVRHPSLFISLHYTDATDKECEIGVIEDMTVFPEAQQKLIESSLAAQYHEQFIRRIYKIRDEYGLLFFEVETQRGREEFAMPWRGDRAEEYGEKGKILLDALDNRYVVPNVEQLPSLDQQRLASFIYW